MNYLDTNVPYELFKEKINSKIYVDKSLLIDKINEYISTDQKYVCITRPRRFGKTMNALMLGAYYTIGCDSQELFHNLKISDMQTFSKHLNQHHVIYIDFSRLPDYCDSFDTYLKSIHKKLMNDLSECFNIHQDTFDTISDALKATNEKFIFLLDEWDSIFYQPFVTENNKSAFLIFLKNLLKDQPYVELAYLTGVLPIVKYSSGSELNSFIEYNFINDNTFDQFFGFTEEEVQALCKQQNKVSFEELRQWYDGYVTMNGYHLLNPRSVVNALLSGVCQNYWTETGPFDEIAQCIKQNVNAIRDDIIKMVSGSEVSVALDAYAVSQKQYQTREGILSAMCVFGFLTYYQGRAKIPNRELLDKFYITLKMPEMGAITEIIRKSEEILQATLNQEEEMVAQSLEQIHDDNTSILSYNNDA